MKKRETRRTDTGSWDHPVAPADGIAQFGHRHS